MTDLARPRLGSHALKPDRATLQKFMDMSVDMTNQALAKEFGIASTTVTYWKRYAENYGIVASGKSIAAMKQQIATLKKQLDQKQREEDSAARIRRSIYNISEHSPAPPPWLSKPTTTSKIRGCPMTIWSDWHYGEVVRKEEVGGVNEFNAGIAQKRIQKLVDSTIELCFHHMGASEAEYPGVVVCLGGDMISGDLHEELSVTNDRTPYQAINDLTDIIASALTRMADAFGKVFVPCVVGNHGRGTHKPRAKQRVWTSFEWSLYTQLDRHFRTDPRVTFMIPEETDAYFSVYGHRFLLTHGDSLGVRGGDGIIGALGPIMRGTIKTSKSEAQIGREFDTIVMGHWHQYLALMGCIVNNSLKGYDEYARVFLRAPYSRPSQALWFVHPRHGVTAHWQVYLEDLARHQVDKTWLKVLA